MLLRKSFLVEEFNEQLFICLVMERELKQKMGYVLESMVLLVLMTTASSNVHSTREFTGAVVRKH